MTGEALAPEPRPPTEKRPWWVPLLGVGSMGIGGLQAVGGLLMLFAGMQLKGSSATTFFTMAAAWVLPGAVLAVSGIGVVTGARWARGLSLAAVGFGVLLVVPVALGRTGIPTAVADLLAVGKAQPGDSSAVPDLLKFATKVAGTDPEQQLRSGEGAEAQQWVLTAECCCPALPWQVVLLLVCGTPMGGRIAGEAGRTQSSGKPEGERRQ